jgi:heptosyltransferase-2
MSSAKRFLIIAPSWIGDLLMSQSLFKYLKSNYDNCLIDIIAKPYLKDFIKLMPEINNTYELDIEHRELGLSKRISMSSKLKMNNYTTAIILTNTFKSAIIPWLMRIPERIGYKKEFRSMLLTKDYKLIKHKDTMVDRYLKLVGATFTNSLRPSLKINLDKAQKYKENYLLKNSNKNIFLCPEAEYGSTKRWPKDYWITLAKYFKKKNFNVYFIGKDKISASEYESIADNVSIVSLIGKTDLDHAAHILSFADLVIANDSGLMHLAASLDVNLISIYGSSSPFYTPPLMKDNHGEVLYRQIKCSPCFKKICPLPGDENLKCLKNISPEEVSLKSKVYLD